MIIGGHMLDELCNPLVCTPPTQLLLLLLLLLILMVLLYALMLVMVVTLCIPIFPPSCPLFISHIVSSMPHSSRELLCQFQRQRQN